MAQAVDALRHGWPIRVGEAPVLLPIETALDAGEASMRALISAARAGTLKLANQAEAADGHKPVLIRAADPLTLSAARPVADPALDPVSPLKGPFAVESIACLPEAEVALELARIAGILPAFLFDVATHAEPLRLKAADLAQWADPARLTLATRARLPLEACEEAEIVAFRKPDDMREHVALVIGQPDFDRTPLVRLHSECLTGDLFGSLKCDCGPQLDAALARMAGETASGGWGVLLYLRQEGRGIGLINKLRAYSLQERGLDTVDANLALGLPADARDYAAAAGILADLGVEKVRLLTNNTDKVTQLRQLGLEIVEQVPLLVGVGPNNHQYLSTKRDRMGHLIAEDDLTDALAQMHDASSSTHGAGA